MTMYRERETKRKRERQERIYSLPLAYTNKIRKRSLWLPREVPSLLLSLSLLSSEPVDSQTHPALFYNRPYIPFVAWKRTREQSSIHSSHLLFTYSPSARYYTPPPPPISLTPISSPSPIPFSQFAPCPRDISPRIQLG